MASGSSCSAARCGTPGSSESESAARPRTRGARPLFLFSNGLLTLPLITYAVSDLALALPKDALKEVGDYAILGRLGRGGMGTVYLGVHQRAGTRVAIKVLAEHIVGDKDLTERFLREAQVVNRIGHPVLIDVFAFGELPDGRSYLVMELLEGESLAARIDRAPFAWADLLGVFTQILSGLAAAHAAGVIHRDLKPENIFVVPDSVAPLGERVKLLDFGVATIHGPEVGVNGKGKRKSKIFHGDRLRIGDLEFVFSLYDEVADVADDEDRAAELAGMRKLSEFNRLLLGIRSVGEQMKALLDAVIDVTHADKGFVLLIRDGAVLVERAEHIISALSPPPRIQTLCDISANDYTSPVPTFDDARVTAARTKMIECLSYTPTRIDEIARTCQLNIELVQVALLELELGGWVERLPGNRIALIDKDFLLDLSRACDR